MKDKLKKQLKFCRLSGMIEHYDDLLKESKENNWSNESFLETLVEYEVIVRENNRFQRLLRQAKFPTLKMIDQFKLF